MAEPLARTLLSRLEAPLASRLRTARELHEIGAATEPAPEPATWTATLPELAALLPDGLPRGALTEVAGRRSSGRMGFLIALVAAATSSGENAALVDLGDGLDPQQAEAAGVVLERLLWARPHDLRRALAATEAVLAGGFPLVVVDLGLPPVPGGRGSDAQWLRLARAARERGARLLVSTPGRRCGIAAAAAFVLDHPRPRWRGTSRSPRLLDGVEATLRLEKARGGIRRAEEETPVRPSRLAGPRIQAPARRGPEGGKSTCARESASVLGAFSPSGPASIPAFCPRTGSANVVPKVGSTDLETTSEPR